MLILHFQLSFELIMEKDVFKENVSLPWCSVKRMIWRRQSDIQPFLEFSSWVKDEIGRMKGCFLFEDPRVSASENINDVMFTALDVKQCLHTKRYLLMVYLSQTSSVACELGPRSDKASGNPSSGVRNLQITDTGLERNTGCRSFT